MHIKQSWQKRVCIKIKDDELIWIFLKHMGDIMYDRDGPLGVVTQPWAMATLIILSLNFP